MKKMKKHLAELLTVVMMFSLLSLPQGLYVKAAETATQADYFIYFDADEGIIYKETGNFSTNGASSWTPEKSEIYTDDTVCCTRNKLELHDFYMFPQGGSAAIVIKGETTLELYGENKIVYIASSSPQTMPSAANIGVYAYDNLSITGSGSLETNAKNVGFYVEGDLTVQEATLIAEGGSYGITANGNITINSGSVTGKTVQYYGHDNPGGSKGSEWGIHTDGNLQINGGTLIGDVTNNRATTIHAVSATNGIAWNPRNALIVGGTNTGDSNLINCLHESASNLPKVWYFSVQNGDTTTNCSYVEMITKVKGINSTSPSNPNLVVGGTTNLEAAVVPETASDQTIIWTSSDEDIATVDDNGTVTAKGEGSATITATTQDGDYKKEFTVTVSKSDITNPDNPSGSGDGTETDNPSASGNGTDTNNPSASGNGTGTGTGTNNPASGDGTGSGTGSNDNPSKSEQSIMDKLGVSADIAKQILDEAAKLGISEDTLLITDAGIKALKSDADIKGSSFGLLKAQATNLKKNSITVKWSKVKDADGYIIYGNKCGAKNSYKKLKTIKKNSTCKFTQKKLKKGTYYKYLVVAYKKIAGTTVTIAAAKTIHATTTGGKYGVAKAVKVNKTKKTLAPSKTFKIKASEIKKDKKIRQHRKIKYESSNRKIATVNGKGVVKAKKKKGSCYIYVYAQNGVYKRVKITVK